VRIFLALLALAASGGVAWADGCRVIRSYPTYSYYAPTYYEPPAKVVEKVREVVVATYVPLAVAVPTYAVGYAPVAAYANPVTAATQAQAAAKDHGQQSECSQRLNSLEQELRSLKNALRRQQDDPQPAPEGVAPPAPAQAPATTAQPVGVQAREVAVIFSRSCASCHEAKVATKEGRGFVLLTAGTLPKFTDADLRKITRELRSGRMPKRKPGQSDVEFNHLKVSDEEFNRWLDFADEYRVGG
jgi:cytochrome c553